MTSPRQACRRGRHAGVLAQRRERRRRRELTNWRLQLRRHWRALAVLGAATVGTVALLIWRRHQREQPLGRLRRMRRALARMIDDPDAVARSPGPGQQVVAAAAKPVVGGIVRRLIG